MHIDKKKTSEIGAAVGVGGVNRKVGDSQSYPAVQRYARCESLSSGKLERTLLTSRKLSQENLRLAQSMSVSLVDRRRYNTNSAAFDYVCNCLDRGLLCSQQVEDGIFIVSVFKAEKICTYQAEQNLESALV